MIYRGEERIYTRLVKGSVRSNRFFQSPKSVSVTNCMTCQFFSLISLYSLQKAGNSDCTAAHSYRSLASSFFFYSWFSLSLSLSLSLISSFSSSSSSSRDWHGVLNLQLVPIVAWFSLILSLNKNKSQNLIW